MTALIQFKTLAVGLLAWSGSALAADFYVAPTGSDSSPGTHAQPFATLARARDAVRQIKASPFNQPVTVWLASGRYLSRDGTEFDSKDSGSPTRPVVYRCLPNASPILSAGVEIPLSALAPIADPAIKERLRPEAREHIRQLDLSKFGIKVRLLKDNLRKVELLDLYFQGKRLPLSRWPNGNEFTTIEKVTDNGMNPAHGGSFVYRGEAPDRWIKAVDDQGVWLRGFWRVPWVIEAAKVAKIDPASKTITFAAPIGGGIGSKYARDKDGIGPGDGREPWYALNLLEEIDQPGEWSINCATNTLYLWPPTEDSTASLFVADRDTPVVAVKNASHLIFQDLTIDGGLGSGFLVSHGNNVVIAGCSICNVGDCGVLIRNGRNHQVTSCTIHDTGMEGISFTGGERKTLTPGNHQIINNEIYNIGLGFPVAGITAGDKTKSETVGNLVAHNRIHDVPNSGIVFAGNDNIFEYNEIYRVGLGSSDLGGFYTSGGWTARGNIVRYNFVHHSMNANAFYVDDGDSGNTFQGNIAYQTASGGFVGGGHDQAFIGNVFVKCLRAMHVDSRGVPRHYDAKDPRLTEDLKSVPYQSPAWSKKYPQLVHLLENHPEIPSGIVIRDNLIVSCDQVIRKSGKPEELKGIIFEGNKVLDDTSVFEDPDNLNFELKPGHSAFANPNEMPVIPFTKIGLYCDEFRGSLPSRDMELLRTGNTERHFDSQTDVNASNR